MPIKMRSGPEIIPGAASLVSPNMINKVGGKENFARLVRKFTDSTIIILKPSLVEFSKPGEIVSDGNMYISVIRQSIPITTKGIDEELKETYLLFHPTFPATVFEGMDGVFKMSIIAYSEDEGNTWFFTGGNKMSLSVENIKPEILEKITIPVHTLIFGEGSDKIILYRQNKQWVRSTSGISEGLAEESIILTIGEGKQIADSPSSTTKQDMPDDSLDAYIYLEEHPGVPIGAFGETDKQSKMTVLIMDLRTNRNHLKISLSLYLLPIIPECITSPIVLNWAQVIYWNLIRLRKHLYLVAYHVNNVTRSK